VVSGERTEGGAAKIAALFCALKFTSPLLTLLSESREQTGVYYPALMPPELLYFFSGPAYSHNAFISRTAKITEITEITEISLPLSIGERYYPVR
jgi:hypothetical protein